MNNMIMEGDRFAITEVRGGVTNEPRLPGKSVRANKLVDQLHEETVALVLDVPDAENPSGFGEAHVPSN